MKNRLYVLIFLLPIPSALLASDIALLKINNDMQKLAKEATSNIVTATNNFIFPHRPANTAHTNWAASVVFNWAH
jgi:hypothetical protein